MVRRLVPVNDVGEPRRVRGDGAIAWWGDDRHVEEERERDGESIRKLYLVVAVWTAVPEKAGSLRGYVGEDDLKRGQRVLVEEIDNKGDGTGQGYGVAVDSLHGGKQKTRLCRLKIKLPHQSGLRAKQRVGTLVAVSRIQSDGAVRTDSSIHAFSLAHGRADFPKS